MDLISVPHMVMAVYTTTYLPDEIPSTVLASVRTVRGSAIPVAVAFQALDTISSAPVPKATVALSSTANVPATTVSISDSSTLRKITVPIASTTAAAPSVGIGLGNLIGIAAGVLAVL